MSIIRKTKSTEILLNEFKFDKTAISAVELIKRLNSKLNKTTIYRVLEKLERNGFLHSFVNQSGFKYYVMCSKCTKSKHAGRHPHFECVYCGKIDCLNLKIKIPEIPNRKISSSNILIQGKCEQCVGLN